MAAASKFILNDYEYINQSIIDDELKCTICTQPFQKPVSLPCQHTFCRECIELWLSKHHSCSCPTCRQSLGVNEDEELSPVNTPIVKNQLDRLLVRCNRCHEINIQRGNFLDHEAKCPKKLVQCLSADIKSPWRGARDEQYIHLATCVFQQIRPIIDRLHTELKLSRKIQNELHEKLETQSDQTHFHFALRNQGNTMNKDCSKSYGKFPYSMDNQNKSKLICHCTLCDNIIRSRDVALQTCSLNYTVDCICQACYEYNIQFEKILTMMTIELIFFNKTLNDNLRISLFFFFEFTSS